MLEVLTEGNVVITDILYDDAALFHFREVNIFVIFWFFSRFHDFERFFSFTGDFFFVKFMEQEKQMILLEFLMAAQHFRDKLMMLNEMNNYDGEQAQNDAMVLYDK